jgi:antitoxin component of MazEF toxin-antitoxin module
MHRKVFRTGNSMVVSLPREALDFLRLEEGAGVSVELDRENRRIVITPAEFSVPGVDENFARQVAEFIEQYRPALDALARG